jgi:hypothetical protein
LRQAVVVGKVYKHVARFRREGEEVDDGEIEAAKETVDISSVCSARTWDVGRIAADSALSALSAVGHAHHARLQCIVRLGRKRSMHWWHRS